MSVFLVKKAKYSNKFLWKLNILFNFVPVMKSINFRLVSFVLASIAVLFASCDDAEEGISYKKVSFPVGEVTWRSDVSAEDQEVITNLINNMVKVDQCQFYMGGQAKTYRRANYNSYFTGRDSIFYRDGKAFTRNLRTEDTVYFNPDNFHFIDTVKTKRDTVRYANVYKAGNFWVGPVIEVSMPDYYIGKYEITQAEWTAVMHRDPTGHYCIVEGYNDAPWYEEIGLGDDVPAYNIWYEDAVAFCDTLNAKTGLNFRLPTEAEWECAARGGKYTRGYKYAGSDTYTEAGWVYSNACAQKIGEEDYGIHPVGEKIANELGLYDMCGNVSEWVSNAYYHYGVLDSINPQGKTPLLDGTDTLIQRGGSWMQSKYVDFSVANRKHVIMSSYTDELSLQSAFVNSGFRIVIGAN